MKNTYREPINGFTHLFGALISCVGLVFMLIKVVSDGGSSAALSGALIFGISLICLYTASSVYHLVNGTDKVLAFLRKIDHSMIFVLIAGTYTPICLLCLDGTLRIVLLSIIWALAIAGVVFKMFWFNAPRWISTASYIGMGWIALFIFSPLSKTLPFMGFFWLILGGIFYTTGGIMYGLKKPNISDKFGFHELFHVFILLGSLSHFILIFNYML